MFDEYRTHIVDVTPYDINVFAKSCDAPLDSAVAMIVRRAMRVSEVVSRSLSKGFVELKTVENACSNLESAAVSACSSSHLMFCSETTVLFISLATSLAATCLSVSAKFFL